MLDASAPVASNEQYITIVNMTPYRSKYLPAQASSYKVGLDFGDIPPRHFRQCVIEHAMSGDKRKDVKAESYFEVGMDLRFNIKIRANYNAFKYN
ncbi:Mutanase [Colletotrichum sp. SAR 10_65]|nr:Mutanase [Colletotrichum sp. SAR 10_65]KAI8177806.1 Mutanase [Colletotrichum sp. SAR 10_75]